MEAQLEQIPTHGTVNLTIQVSAAMNYSPVVARRLVSRFVANEVGYLLRGGEPKLVAGTRLVWRVPVLLALPKRRITGEVGTIDVDVETGQLLITPQQIDAMIANGERFAA